ncbi:MAG: DNA-directed RNA polymerase, subunit M/Transcription elongation factor TFIIS [Candidatus Lokiarchaeum sp. GC14_75]|nr:MAG: DNA-directed RNA polymerase, subunit M/Transcription elongation factor TFIIS [Candidatus Lokiarchaeum sp. GC14_75]
MRFCPDCDNILIPKNKKLYCKACDKEFDLGSDNIEYKIQKKIHHDESETAPIILKEGIKGERISSSDRRAYEDYFSSSGSEGY